MTFFVIYASCRFREGRTKKWTSWQGLPWDKLGQEESPFPKHTITRTIDVLAIGTEVLTISAEQPEWATDIIKFLYEGEVPSDKDEAWKVRKRAFL